MEEKEIKGVIEKVELKDKADGSGQYTKVTIDGLNFTCFKSDLKEVLEEGNDVAIQYVENGKFKNIIDGYILFPEIEKINECSNIIKFLSYELERVIESKNNMLKSLKTYDEKIKEYELAIERLKK